MQHPPSSLVWTSRKNSERGVAKGSGLKYTGVFRWVPSLWVRSFPLTIRVLSEVSPTLGTVILANSHIPNTEASYPGELEAMARAKM